VVPIFWGEEYWTGPVNFAIEVSTFLTNILSSAYIGLLSEYNVGMATLENDLGIAYQGGPQTLSEGDIQNAITSWVDEALLPIPDENETDLLFLLFVPSAVTLTLGGVSQNDPANGFSGYHLSGKHGKALGKDNLFYAVVVWSGFIQAMTATASHELAEAFTDRSGAGWYSDDQQFLFWSGGREIGDICDCIGGPSLLAPDGSVVASYWRNSVGACLQQIDLTPGLTGIVPDVVTDSLSPAAARAAIEGAGFVYSETADPVEGHFKPFAEDQNPSGGTVAQLESTVEVTIAVPHRGPTP
jgi:hypothetical protein